MIFCLFEEFWFTPVHRAWAGSPYNWCGRGEDTWPPQWILRCVRSLTWSGRMMSSRTTPQTSRRSYWLGRSKARSIISFGSEIDSFEAKIKVQSFYSSLMWNAIEVLHLFFVFVLKEFELLEFFVIFAKRVLLVLLRLLVLGSSRRGVNPISI